MDTLENVNEVITASQVANVTVSNTNLPKQSNLQWKELEWYPVIERNGVVTFHSGTFGTNKRKRIPRIIFICKANDLFHEKVPFSFIERVMKDIESAPQHIHITLTEHAERMAQFFANRSVPKNLSIWANVDNNGSGGYPHPLSSINAIVAHKALKALNG